MKKLLLFVLLALGALCAPASAQQHPQALIVSICGTPPVSYVAGFYGFLTMDTTGKLCDSATGGGGGGGAVTLPTVPAIASGNGVVIAPTAEAAAGLSTGACTTLCSNLVVKASPGNIFSFNVSADTTLSGAAWWLMFFNSTTLPADGTVTPAKCYALPSGTTSYSAAFPVPVAFATGIVMGVSSTGCFTKTASVHAFISGDFK